MKRGREKSSNKSGRFGSGCRRMRPNITAATTPLSTCLAGPIFCTPAFFFRCRAITFSLGSNRSGTCPISLGSPPEMLRADLISLRNSMNSILRFQYFITKEMRTDLGRGNVSGTLPILYVFLARLGYTIVDVTHVSTPAEGVKITFQRRRTTANALLFQNRFSRRRKQRLPSLVCRPRARPEFAQSRFIPHARRRILRRAQFPSCKTVASSFRTIPGFRCAMFPERLESELLRPLRSASRGIREVSPA